MLTKNGLNIDPYLNGKTLSKVFYNGKLIYPVEETIPEDAVAILISEDNTITQYFSSYTDAATYVTNNSDTNWNLIAKKGTISSREFANITNLISLTLEEGVTGIYINAFYGCTGLTGSLVIPDSVISIGNYAFYGCTGLTGSLVIPDSVTSIGQYAFRGCTGFNGSLTIGNSVTSIGQYAFYGCSGFTGSLTIGNSVTSIGSYVFYGCSGLTGSLSIPDSVTSIGAAVFARCSGFDDDLSYYGINNPATYTNVFSNSSFTICKVPVDYEDDTFCGLSISKELDV